jgi:hypothetical protein
VEANRKRIQVNTIRLTIDILKRTYNFTIKNIHMFVFVSSFKNWDSRFLYQDCHKTSHKSLYRNHLPNRTKKLTPSSLLRSRNEKTQERHTDLNQPPLSSPPMKISSLLFLWLQPDKSRNQSTLTLVLPNI